MSTEDIVESSRDKSKKKNKKKGDSNTRVTLEVEDEEARQQRLQSLLESIDATSASSKGPPAPQFPLPPSRPHAVPPSDVLSRAAAFLPLLASSNAELANVDPESLNIEHLEDEEGAHIEMNLGLGVFE
ncbi:hypothetical protein M422DRAFT_165170, partial [Sphaerobolus stellatus SS14]